MLVTYTTGKGIAARLPRLAAVLVAWTVPSLANGVLPVTVDVGARALGPGEPLRVEVFSSETLAAVEGRFLGRAVCLVRAGDDERGERWSGWTMIALDDEAGIAAVEVSGRTLSGRPVAGTRALTIQAREFPRETLTVAPKYVEPPPEVRRRIDRERETLAAVYESRRPVVPAGRPFLRPVPGEPTSVFGTRRFFNEQPRALHPGLDLRASTGTPVISSGAGRIALAADLYYAGTTVIVDHGGGLFTVYAHLSELLVENGDEVVAGQRIGLSGATGRVTGPHLHWGAKIGDRPFDPEALLDPRLFPASSADQ